MGQYNTSAEYNLNRPDSN
uniref:Uncharacterized protein n=1 Tax=Anguilla anguilla TaxID=7936 RepID=A0A0E9Q657_ANGAN